MTLNSWSAASARFSKLQNATLSNQRTLQISSDGPIHFCVYFFWCYVVPHIWFSCPSLKVWLHEWQQAHTDTASWSFEFPSQDKIPWTPLSMRVSAPTQLVKVQKNSQIVAWKLGARATWRIWNRSSLPETNIQNLISEIWTLKFEATQNVK